MNTKDTMLHYLVAIMIISVFSWMGYAIGNCLITPKMVSTYLNGVR